MTAVDDVSDDLQFAEDLFEDAPCGYLFTTLDGRVLRANATLERWLGVDRGALVQQRFRDLLTVGGRIYHETHLAPLLQMQGSVREIALDMRRADGTVLPVLINSVISPGADGEPGIIRSSLFDVTDRRRYERELLRTGEREHAIAEELQRSLLAGELPVDDRLEIGVVYHPAVVGLDVGGDWYDAFWTDPGHELAIVVGDVVGRGIAAAATMGQLRSAVRALAGTGLAPAAVLDQLEHYAVRHEIGTMATVVYAHVDLDGGTMRFACAGHPPPVVLRPGEGAELEWSGRSVPLVAMPSRTPRPDATVSLEPGTTVLLFSDGLFERRDRSLDDGLDLLRHEAGARAALPVGELAEGVVAAMTDAEARDDDVCLLALRRR